MNKARILFSIFMILLFGFSIPTIDQSSTFDLVIDVILVSIFSFLLGLELQQKP